MPAERKQAARDPSADPARHPRAQRSDTMSDLEIRISRLEQGSSLRERASDLLARGVPIEAAHHFRRAARENLLGVRTLVDFWLERLDASEGRPSASPRRESIDID